MEKQVSTGSFTYFSTEYSQRSLSNQDGASHVTHSKTNFREYTELFMQNGRGKDPTFPFSFKLCQIVVELSHLKSFLNQDNMNAGDCILICNIFRLGSPLTLPHTPWTETQGW